MDRPSILPVDSEFLYYIRSASGHRIQVHNFINWHEIATTDSRHPLRPRCCNVAGADRVSREFYRRSRLDTWENRWRNKHGCKLATYELYYNCLLGIWYVLEPEGSRDGRRSGFTLGWSTRSVGEAYEDFWFRYNCESLDQYRSLYYALMDSRKLPRLHDWWRFHEPMRLRLRGHKTEAGSISSHSSSEDLQEDGGGSSP